MRDDLGAVHAAPDKGVRRERIEIAPAHFGRIEVFHPAALHDLRDRRVVAEGIRKPERVGGVAEILPGEALSVEELTHHRFAAGDVAVALDPNAAVRLVSSLRHAFLDPLENGGVFTAHPVEMEGGGLDEGVFRIDVHQCEHLGIGTRAFANRFRHRPEPRGIHMGMADHTDKAARRIVIIGFCKRGGKGGADRLYGSIYIRHIRVIDLLHEIRERVHEAFVGGFCEKIIGRQTRHLEYRGQIEHHAADRTIENTEPQSVKTMREILPLVSGIAFKVKRKRFPGNGMLCNKHCGMLTA